MTYDSPPGVRCWNTTSVYLFLPHFFMGISVVYLSLRSYPVYIYVFSYSKKLSRLGLRGDQCPFPLLLYFYPQMYPWIIGMCVSIPLLSHCCYFNMLWFGYVQSLCLLGYCLFPLDASALLCVLLGPAASIAKWILVPVAVAWSCWASVPFIGGAVPPRRKGLAIYPLCLLYVAIGWLTVVK